MSITKFKQCLFSEVNGVINFEGKPASGVRLVRMVDHNSKKYDETVTDEHGNFHFPTLFRTNIIGQFLPMTFVVRKEINVYRDGEEYNIWRAVTQNSESNYESRGEPLVVTCELTAEEELITVNSSHIFTKCTWDVEQDPPFDFSKYDLDPEDQKIHKENIRQHELKSKKGNL